MINIIFVFNNFYLSILKRANKLALCTYSIIVTRLITILDHYTKVICRRIMFVYHVRFFYLFISSNLVFVSIPSLANFSSPLILTAETDSFPLPPRVQCIQIDMFREVWNARYIALIRIDDDGKIDPAWWKTRPIWKL